MVVRHIIQKVLKNPLLVSQAFQVSTLLCTGDLLGQTVVLRKPINEIDFRRTLKVGLVGLFIIGPTVSTFFRVLAVTISNKDPYVGLKKMLIDQLVFVPFILIPLFVTSINIFVNGNSWEKTKEEIKDKYKDIMKTNYKIWPFVQFVNFNYVPIAYQVLVTQSVAVLWNTYLTWKTVRINKPEPKK
ncbi:mpv17-like protein [Diorhabda carinulata]|uniref:mpv17-like protein n=1 Tax=Diorhabda carinulata TaxID=1163345 RepID=UPI0025A26E29|nr:mpv17-like protein [Diorhabda carinulata]